MTPVAAPADKRFRRSRVSPARKTSWRPSWWTVARVTAVCLVVGFALYRTVTFVLASEALTVTRISVQGNQRMSRGEVLGLLDGLSGSSIVMTDLDGWRQKLLASPWVADASIRRMFPGTLAVVVVERAPMGVGRISGALYLIDETGTVIDEFGPNYADLDLPIVDGLTSKGGDHDAVDQARAALAGRLMVDLQRRPGLAEQVSQIDVTDAHNAAVILKGDTALLRVGDEHFAERVQSYLDLMPALREQMPDLDYVDLRFGERVYVRPQPQTKSRRAAADQSRLRASGASAEQARVRASGASAEQARVGASGASTEPAGSRAPAGQADGSGKRPRAERRSGG